MNLQKAEQAVKNAQNQLDEAMRQLEAAKKPIGQRWIIDGRGRTCFVQEIPGAGAYVFYVNGAFGPSGIGYDGTYILDGGNWRYAEKGEVNISW